MAAANAQPLDAQGAVPQPLDALEAVRQPLDALEAVPRPLDAQEPVPRPLDAQEAVPRPLDAQEAVPRPLDTQEATKLIRCHFLLAAASPRMCYMMPSRKFSLVNLQVLSSASRSSKSPIKRRQPLDVVVRRPPLHVLLQNHAFAADAPPLAAPHLDASRNPNNCAVGKIGFKYAKQQHKQNVRVRDNNMNGVEEDLEDLDVPRLDAIRLDVPLLAALQQLAEPSRADGSLVQ